MRQQAIGREEVKEGKMLKKRRKREHIVKKYLILITDMFEGKKERSDSSTISHKVKCRTAWNKMKHQGTSKAEET